MQSTPGIVYSLLVRFTSLDFEHSNPRISKILLLSVTVLLAFTAKISCRNMEFKLIHFCFLFYSVGNYFLLCTVQ